MSNGSRIRRTAALVAVLLTAGIIYGAAASGQPPTPVGVAPGPPVEDPGPIPDSSWSWWTHPVAVDTNDGLVVGGVGTNGQVTLSRIDGNERRTVTLGTVRADDHSAPAVAWQPGKPLVAVWTGHGQDTTTSWRIETEPGSFEFGPLHRLEWDTDTATYTQLLHHDSDRIVMLTRAPGNQWRYRISEDWGASWSDASVLLDDDDLARQVYITTSPAEDGRFHLAAAPHPIFDAWTGVVYGTLDLDTGDIAGGNIYSGDGLPLTPSDLEPAIDADPDKWRVRLLDVGEVDGDPAVSYAVWPTYDRPDMDADEARYRVTIRQPDGSWQPTTVRWAGEVFGHKPDAHYHGGAVLADDALYTASEDAGTWAVERWGWSSGGWTLAETVDTSTDPLIRPYGGLVYQHVHRYDSYKEFEIDGRLVQGSP